MDIKKFLKKKIVSDDDIDAIIGGTYENGKRDGPLAATDQDIDDIIAGGYVDKTEDGEEDDTDKEIKKIIQNAFGEER